MRSYKRFGNNSAFHYSLSTIRMLPFQGEIVVGNFNPTRWVGLVYVAPSGRKKISINLLE
ncbi:MAG: hypothetical protein LBP87_13255 [Planctomycetaceae bacterium]|jgi:hypothetical protein|nr:hypothetical protein [Planctomycetaceae bacterium]